MASIRERENKNGDIKYHVSIRKKDQNICASFDDLETAKLFVKVKENVIDDMESFNIPAGDLIRLKDAYFIKLEDMEESKLSHHTVADVKNSYSIFKDILGEDFYLNDLTFEKIKEISTTILKRKIHHGGNRKDPRNLKISSPATARRVLASFSSIYGTLVKKGIDIKNPFQEFMIYFSNTYMKK